MISRLPEVAVDWNTCNKFKISYIADSAIWLLSRKFKLAVTWIISKFNVPGYLLATSWFKSLLSDAF